MANRPHQIWVGNIPYGTTEEDLHNILSSVGPVVTVRIRYDKETGQSKGFGFCEYQDAESCELAMKHLHGTLIGGRSMRLDYCSSEQVRALQLESGRPPPADASLASMMASRSRDPPRNEEGVAPTSEIPLRVEIARIVETLTAAQLFYVLGHMQKFVVESPELARSVLRENPSLCYALLHAQFICGMVKQPFAAVEDPVVLNQVKDDAYRRQQEHVKYLHERNARVLGEQEAAASSRSDAFHRESPRRGLFQRPSPSGSVSSDYGKAGLASTRSHYVEPVEGPRSVTVAPPPILMSSVDTGSKAAVSYPEQAALGGAANAALTSAHLPNVQAIIDQIIAAPEILQQIASVSPEQEAAWTPEERAEIMAVRVALRERGITL